MKMLLLLSISLLNYVFSYNINNINNLKFGTNVVHGIDNTDDITGNFVTPIILGTTFTQVLPGEKPGKNDLNSHGNGYFYSRMGNPTRGELERTLALTEKANYSAVFSSGMASIFTIIQILDNGDHVIAMDDLYGGTINYFKEFAYKKNGINFTYINENDFNNLENYINKNTKMIWVESLTNPLLKTVNVAQISQIAKKYNLLLVVDSTFTSPYLFNPLEHGADIVVHSATKYIGGHSDIIMGTIMCNDKNIIKKIRLVQSNIGAIPSPFECYLALRGLKTLHIRMKESQLNAMILANYFETHPMIDRVIYPGLKSYPNYKLVKNQFRGPGSIISIYIKGDLKTTNKFLKSLKIFKLAVSLGAVESLLCAPALMTHATIPKEIREKNGITDNLIRISIGIEDINDLINDMDQALNNIK